MLDDRVLSAICAALQEKHRSDSNLAVKLTDEAVQHYVRFCNARKVGELPACPVCFLIKGRIEHLLPPRPSQRQVSSANLICEFCAAHFPVELDG